METLRDKIEITSLITGFAAAALAGITEILPEQEHFTNMPIWAVAAGAMATYIGTFIFSSDQRLHRESNSAFSKEKEHTEYTEYTSSKDLKYLIETNDLYSKNKEITNILDHNLKDSTEANIYKFDEYSRK
jgi:hypothetical protein